MTAVGIDRGLRSVARSLAHRRTAPTAAALLGFGVTPLAAAEGGYFPVSWGWASVALAWTVVMTLIAATHIRLSRLELVVGAGAMALSAWGALSLLWSDAPALAVLDLQRIVLYALAVAAALVLVKPSSYRALLGGVWGGASVVCVYAVFTRLFPDELPVAHTVANNRLSEPVGYWNGLATLAAMGSLLALGLAAHSRRLVVRGLAAGSVVPLALTLYFTFSRGGWIALASGFAIALAVDSQRLRLALATTASVPWAAVAVALAAREPALTQIRVTSDAAQVGRDLFPSLALVSAASVATVFLLALGERRVRLGARAERRFVRGLAAAAAIALAAVFVRIGGPVTLAERGWEAFNAPPVHVRSSLNERLFSFSGSWRVELWEVAWADFVTHPLAGAGAGSYERTWMRERAIPSKVRNAHNLYLETLAETGLVGLGAVVALLAPPLVGGIRARRHGLVPAALGAYAAFIVHSAVDWDWELPAVTLAALFVGAALLAAGRRDVRVPSLPFSARIAIGAAALALGAFAAYGLAGNRSLAAAEDALLDERYVAVASHVEDARRWVPWSDRPFQLLAEAQLAQGRLYAARSTLGRALAKDSGNWETWLDLALASERPQRRRAAALRALRLNPLSPEIRSIAPALGVVDAATSRRP